MASKAFHSAVRTAVRDIGAFSLFLATYGLLLTNPSAFASGFEKSIPFSGRYAGVADTATAIVGGAESVFFNPAGLASGDYTGQVSLNFSPTFGAFNGPVSTTTAESGDRTFSPVPGVMVSYKAMPKLGFGVGYYAAGGTKSQLTNIGFTGFGAGFKTTGDLKTDLSLLELAVGAGYEICDGLRIGLAWRMLFANAAFSSFRIAPAGAIPVPTLTFLSFAGLSDTRYNGWKLGAQYAPTDSVWGIGAVWRTAVQFNAAGTVSGSFEAPGLPTPLSTVAATPATVGAEFPMQISFGGYSWLSSEKKYRVMAEYVFSQYSNNTALNIGATPSIPAGVLGPSAVPFNVPNVELNWYNQSNLRVGGESLAIENLALRWGYVFTSQVTPGDKAKAQLTAPGSAHTFAVGAGTAFMDKKLGVDLAVEYTTVSGDGVDASTNDPSPTYQRPGSFNDNAYAFHLGVTYTL